METAHGTQPESSEFEDLVFLFKGADISSSDRKAEIARTMDIIAGENPNHQLGDTIDTVLDIPIEDGGFLHRVSFSSPLTSSAIKTAQGTGVIALERSKSEGGVIVDSIELVGVKVNDFLNAGSCLFGSAMFATSAALASYSTFAGTVFCAAGSVIAAGAGIRSLLRGMRR